MKYSEVEQKLKKAGCYEDGEMNGHPMWYSPLTDKYFKMSHHKSQEVAKGTLNSISNDSGVKL
jgi:predicted RNA binding protein YcfA (HicA-like mRNA interferase family)